MRLRQVLIAPHQSELLAVAIKWYNLPSVATPNGRSSTLVLYYHHRLRINLKLSYGRMVYMALP